MYVKKRADMPMQKQNPHHISKACWIPIRRKHFRAPDGGIGGPYLI